MLICENLNFKNILKDISLTISKNERVAIVGNSGSGKSTLLEIFSRNNMAIGFSSSFKESVSYQNYESSFNPKFKMKDQLKLSKKVISLMKLLSLKRELIDRYPKELSGGEQQLFSIIRAISEEHDLLILDEPFTALDRKRNDILIDYIRKEERSYIISSHNLALLSKICDRFITIDKGKIIEYKKRSY